MNNWNDLLVDFFDPTKSGYLTNVGSPLRLVELLPGCVLNIDMTFGTLNIVKEFKKIPSFGGVTHKGKLPVLKVTYYGDKGMRCEEYFNWLGDPKHIELGITSLKQKGVPYDSVLIYVLNSLLLNTPGSALNRFLPYLEHVMYDKIYHSVWFDDTYEDWFERFPESDCEPTLRQLQSMSPALLQNARISDFDGVALMTYAESFGMITPVDSSKDYEGSGSYLLPTREVLTYQGFTLNTQPYNSQDFGYTQGFSDRNLVDRYWANGEHYFNN